MQGDVVVVVGLRPYLFGIFPKRFLKELLIRLVDNLLLDGFDVLGSPDHVSHKLELGLRVLKLPIQPPRSVVIDAAGKLCVQAALLHGTNENGVIELCPDCVALGRDPVLNLIQVDGIKEPSRVLSRFKQPPLLLGQAGCFKLHALGGVVCGNHGGKALQGIMLQLAFCEVWQQAFRAGVESVSILGRELRQAIIINSHEIRDLTQGHRFVVECTVQKLLQTAS